MKSVTIDRSKRLKDEATTGHNRWNPDVPPIVEVAPGEDLVLETRYASDGQIMPQATVADLDGMDTKVAHPLTGPVFVQGAVPGDLSSGPHHQDSGEAKIRESTAGVSRKPSSDGKARGCSSKHLCGLTAWNT